MSCCTMAQAARRSGRQPQPWAAGVLLACLLELLLLAPSCSAVPTIPQLQDRLAPDSEALAKLWAEHEQQLGRIQVDGQPLTELMGPIARYPFSLHPIQLRRSLFNFGSKARLRRVVSDLFTGRKHVKIGVIGTSVSWGTGATLRGTQDWVSMLPVALRMAFPKANVTVRNGCFPATGSGFANMCLSHMVDPDVDLVFMEFVTNDFVPDMFYGNPLTRAFERLVRKALQLPMRPAVVFLQVPTWGQCFDEAAPNHKEFHASAEDMYGAVAQLYSIPVLSVRDAVWHEADHRSRAAAETQKLLASISETLASGGGAAAAGGNKNMALLLAAALGGEAAVTTAAAYEAAAAGKGRKPFVSPAAGWSPGGWHDIMTKDLAHPNDRGHRMLLDLFMWAAQRTVIDLVLHPLGRADARAALRPLPPPMHEGNWEEARQLCMLDEGLRDVVDERATRGWEFVNEGTEVKKKTGYVAIAPGSVLSLRLNMSLALGRQNVDASDPAQPPKSRQVGVMIAYLQSYTRMGRVRVACNPALCTCDEKVLDSQHEQRTSTTFSALLVVEARGPACSMSVTVLPESSSDGHKFKVSAVMLNRMDAMGFSWPTDRSAQWELHDMFDGTWGSGAQGTQGQQGAQGQAQARKVQL